MFGRLTPLVKKLLFINIGIHILNSLLLRQGVSLNEIFGLSNVNSDTFKPFQFVTYMFLHSTDGIMHLLGNMFALFIFGPILENFLGQKKFLILYMVTGIGAGVFYSTVNYVEVVSVRKSVDAYAQNPNSQDFNALIVDHNVYKPEFIYNFVDQYSRNEDSPSLIAESIELARGITRYFGGYNMTGASGAVFGLLAAFALFFPNLELFLLFLPFPVKAKYFIGFYILYELYSEFQQAPGDSVAHLAHIGGALIAYVLVRLWRQQGNKFP